MIFDVVKVANEKLFSLPFRMSDLRSDVISDDGKVAKEKLSSISTGSYGYGGKFGVEKDRMDKVNILDNE